MNDYHDLRALVLFAADSDRATGAIDLDAEGDAAWLDTLTGIELGDMLSEAERMIRAARVVKARVEQALLADVEANGRIRLGDYGYYSGTETRRRMVDRDGLIKFLNDMGGLRAIGDTIRIEADASNVRVSTLDGIARENGIDPQTIRGQFFEEESGQVVLAKAYAAKTKWVEKLPEGGRA